MLVWIWFDFCIFVQVSSGGCSIQKRSRYPSEEKELNNKRNKKNDNKKHGDDGNDVFDDLSTLIEFNESSQKSTTSDKPGEPRCFSQESCESNKSNRSSVRCSVRLLYGMKRPKSKFPNRVAERHEENVKKLMETYDALATKSQKKKNRNPLLRMLHGEFGIDIAMAAEKDDVELQQKMKTKSGPYATLNSSALSNFFSTIKKRATS